VKLKGFEIIKFEFGKKAAFYTIKLYGESESETDKFLIKHSVKKAKQISEITRKINLMVNKRGCLETLISKEYGNIYKFSEGNLRLYCLLFGKVAVVLGGGGIKEVRATQDSIELSSYVSLLDIVDKEITNRIKLGDLTITDNRFEGDLNFNLENN
jgi:hypothetical protein